ncbi:Solute carrier family 40 member 1-like protein [Cladobotryum mycophilum]|uniref:Solute carrier family 40 member n=1 Tax=Cladobotryum mycophilum TaxID=491253 RepID=A0ABR0SJX5_9HYPO
MSAIEFFSSREHLLPDVPLHTNDDDYVHVRNVNFGGEPSHGLLAFEQADASPGDSTHRLDVEPLERPDSIPKSIALRLYTSHFLSTWNSRLFEFGAVLFLSSIFPSTLLPMSVYALVRSASAILFAQTVGLWVDHGHRLKVVRVSILGQRIAVAMSCALFLVMERMGGGIVRDGCFAAVVVLACVERLCAVMNLVAVERDWVVIITEEMPSARQELNTQMRRIDLLCKLVGPLVISTVTIVSTLMAIYVTLAMNLLSVLVEYICIEQVYRSVPALRRERPFTEDNSNGATSRGSDQPNSRPSPLISRTLPISSLPFYFRHSAFLPSMALALLYLTVLSFSGQMLTFLLAVGYTSAQVGVARTLSTALELSATWVGPKLMKRIGVVRAGIWSLSWQMIWLTAGVGWFLNDTFGNRTVSTGAAIGLVVGVAMSRVGLWGYDLCAQLIVQDEVEDAYRGTFSMVEAAFQNLFELLSYATTIIFSKTDQFQWPAIVSVAAVYLAGGLYAFSVRKRRGHLIHAPACVCIKD